MNANLKLRAQQLNDNELTYQLVEVNRCIQKHVRGKLKLTKAKLANVLDQAEALLEVAEERNLKVKLV